MTVKRKVLLIVGSTSDIAKATARVFGRNDWHVTLAGRNLMALDAVATDLALRIPDATADALCLDVLDMESFPAFLDALPSLPDAVLVAVGLLGDQKRAETDSEHARLIIRTNFEGPAAFLNLIAARFEARGGGTIIGISSVAGERGRASNYVYGASKAGFSAFLSGLRNRLARKDILVITVKPGFVRTRTTEGMNLPCLLTAEPEEVANAIFSAVTARKDVIYVRPIWRLIMLIIRSIPERAFKKMSI